MTFVSDGIRANDDNTLDFGNYTAKDKQKIKDFEVSGDMYSLKTHNEITRLEKNGILLIEAVPGASFFGFSVSESAVSFKGFGAGDTKITLELEPEAEYMLRIDSAKAGGMKSNKSGKISFSLDLGAEAREVLITRE